MDGPGVVRGNVVAHRLAVAHRALLADQPVVADGPGVAWGQVVADRPAVAPNSVFADGPSLAHGCVVAGRSARPAVLASRSPRRDILASGSPGRSVVTGGPGSVLTRRAAGWAVLAGRALVTDGRIFGGRHLAGVAVAGRLAAAALRGRRRRLGWRLAAGRLRSARGPVTPLRGRSAFAPRTTRTLGW